MWISPFAPYEGHPFLTVQVFLLNEFAQLLQRYKQMRVYMTVILNMWFYIHTHICRKAFSTTVDNLWLHTASQILQIYFVTSKTQWGVLQIYKLMCDDCDAFYVGQTGRSFLKRFTEHRLPTRLHSLDTVSYTHLDVYKRQPQRTSRFWISFLYVFLSTQSFKEIPCFIISSLSCFLYLFRLECCQM